MATVDSVLTWLLVLAIFAAMCAYMLYRKGPW